MKVQASRSSPGAAYYAGLVGRWRSPYTLTLTDPAALAASGASAADRLSLRAMDLSIRRLGPVTFSTTLAADGEDWVHTTRLSRYGLSLFWSRERIVLDPDGRTATLTGTGRSWPFAWQQMAITARVTFSEDAQGATYELPMFGTKVLQRTKIVPEGLSFEHEAPSFQAHALLRRLP